MNYWNYLSANLITKGYLDTEVILELFERYGLDTIIPKPIGCLHLLYLIEKIKRFFYVGIGLELSYFIGEYSKMS